MSRLDYRATEKQILAERMQDFLAASLAVTLQEMNELRQQLGLPLLTKQDFLEKVKTRLRAGG